MKDAPLGHLGDLSEFAEGLPNQLQRRLCVAPMGRRPELREFAHADSLFETVEAFARAVSAATPFPIAPAQMLDTIGAFEAVIEAANTGRRMSV